MSFFQQERNWKVGCITKRQYRNTVLHTSAQFSLHFYPIRLLYKNKQAYSFSDSELRNQRRLHAALNSYKVNTRSKRNWHRRTCAIFFKNLSPVAGIYPDQ